MNPGQIAFAAHTGAAVVDREVLREDHDRALRHVVGAPARSPLEPFDARDRHDAAALSVDERLLEHAGDRVLAHEEGSREIDVEHALPLVAVEQVRGTAARDTGCSHDRVQPTVLGDRGVDDGRDRGFVPHIRGNERDLGRVGRKLHCVLRLGHVETHDARALLHEARNAHETDTGCRARDQRDLAFEASHS